MFFPHGLESRNETLVLCFLRCSTQTSLLRVHLHGVLPSIGHTCHEWVFAFPLLPFAFLVSPVLHQHLAFSCASENPPLDRRMAVGAVSHHCQVMARKDLNNTGAVSSVPVRVFQSDGQCFLPSHSIVTSDSPRRVPSALSAHLSHTAELGPSL